MQQVRMERVRESFELVIRGGIIATFVLLMFGKPLSSSLEQSLLDILPEASVEGTMEKPKLQKQEQSKEVVSKKWVSIHQEDILRVWLIK